MIEDEYSKLFTSGHVFKGDMSEPDFEAIKSQVFAKKNVIVNKKTGDVKIKLPDGNTLDKRWSDIYKMILCLSNNHVSRLIFLREKYKEYVNHRYSTEISTDLDKFAKEDELVLFDYMTCDDFTKQYYDWCIKEGKAYVGEEYDDALGDIYKYLMCFEFTCAIYQWIYLKTVFDGTNVPFIKEFFEQSDLLIKSTVKDMGELNYIEDMWPVLLKSLVDDDSDAMKEARDIYTNMDPLSDKDVIDFFTSTFNEDGITYFMRNEAATLLKRKSVLKYFIEKKYFTKDEFVEHINEREVVKMYCDTKNEAFLEYISNDGLIWLHLGGKLPRKALVKRVPLKELLTSNIDSEEKVNILTDGVDARLYAKSESSLIWRLFEDNKFTIDQVKALEQLRYMHKDTILRNYQESQEHKIKAELGNIPNVSDEKMLSFFTPDLICNELVKDNCNVGLYMNNLTPLYEKNERNLSDEIMNEIKSLDEKEAVETALALYKKGALGAEYLKEANVPEDCVKKILSDNYSEELLIKFFNAGCISQDTAIDYIGEYFDVKVFDLIKAGMNANVIAGFYSTKDLIEMTNGKFPKLTAEDLAHLKDDIKTGLGEKTKQGTTLLSMYLSGELSYSQLFDLQQAGVISEEDANEINAKYNLGRELETLQKLGIKGQSLDNMYAAKVNESRGKKSGVPRSGNSAPKKSKIGTDESFIIDLYTRLGANDIYSIDGEKCPVFDGYMIIPVIDMKIGFLEGSEGRTYILPLKIILEQINNPKGELDVIGNATSRSGFNNEKKYVSSTNHTKNWVKNTLKKALEMSQNTTPEQANKILKDCADLIKKSQEVYKAKKDKEIN